MVRNWWNTAGGSAEAPLASSRTPSIDSRSDPSALQDTYIGGAPATLVTPSSRIAASDPRGSKRSRSTVVAPTFAASPSPAFNP